MRKLLAFTVLLAGFSGNLWAANTGVGPFTTNDATTQTNTGTTATGIGAPGDAAWSGSGSASIIAAAKAIYGKVAGTLAISAASLPLPAGAATAAKQPALGTAGSASADVLTVQGIASMTAIKVDGSAVTQPVTFGPSGSSAAAIAPIVSSALESGHVLKASAGNLYSVYVTTDSTTSGYLMVFDATSAPADGAVTPKHCVTASANYTTSISFGSGPPESYATGIVAVFSTTGCFSKTASAHGFIHGSVQ